MSDNKVTIFGYVDSVESAFGDRLIADIKLAGQPSLKMPYVLRVSFQASQYKHFVPGTGVSITIESVDPPSSPRSSI